MRSRTTLTSWPAQVERVVGVLREAGVEARVEEFRSGTPTADDAASAAGCRLEQIVKSLVFSCDGRWLLVMVPGDRRADGAKIANAAGCERATIAGADEVAHVTGFEVGGVAPFPLPGVDAVFIDRSLLAHEVVWVGAGSSRHMAVLAPAELARLARARTADLVSENGS